MKIIIPDDYQDIVRKLGCFALLADHEVVVYHDSCKDIDTLVARFAEADAIVLTRERTAIGADLLARLPKLRCISQTGKAGDHIDLAACEQYGVTVLEGSGSPIAPAELTWVLIMNALRQLPQAIEAMKGGHWQVNIGESVAGKTIGIWGYGKIGRRIARYAQAFDAQVLVWGSEASRQAAIVDGYTAASSKDEFFAQSDVVTLHLRLVPATRGIVTAADLERMKPGALFVNTSRAALVVEGALLQALTAGRPGFAALDVFDQEPILDPKHPLLIHPKVICTPHLGYVERNGYELYFGQAFGNLLGWFESGG